MSEDLHRLVSDLRACRACSARFADTHTAHAPQPAVWLSERAPVLVASQAPGLRVHGSGMPFDDASGDRLRTWLGVTRDVFYDRRFFAFAPMAFCFPGYDAKGGDLPPPPLCATMWRGRVLRAMPQVRLTILIGGYAMRWHLGARNVTEAVTRWREAPEGIIPLPHPSWRNTGWLKRNPWFEAELLPVLRARVRDALGEAA